jgi:hypothetical protein
VTSVVVVLISLVVTIVTTSSLRRQGRLSRSLQMVLIGIMLGALAAVAMLAWRNRAG